MKGYWLCIFCIFLYCSFISDPKKSEDESDYVSLYLEVEKEYSEVLNINQQERKKLILAKFEIIDPNEQPFLWTLWKLKYADFQYNHNQSDLSLALLDSLTYRWERQSESLAIALICEVKARIYQSVYQNDLSAENYYKAADLFVKYDLTDKAISAYYRAAHFQYDARNYSEALPTIKLIIALLSSMENLNEGQLNRLKQTYNLNALCYAGLLAFDSALVNYERSLNLAMEMEQRFWAALVKGNMGNLYIKQGRYEEAIPNLLIDFKISRESKEWVSASNAAISLAKAFAATGRRQVALQYLDSANRLVEQHDVLMSKPALYEVYANLYHAGGDYKNAFYYNRLFQVYMDSVANIRKDRELSQLKTRYDFERATAEIELLHKNNTLQEEQYRQTLLITLFVVIIAVLATLLGVVLYINVRRLKRINFILDDKVQKRTEDLEAKNKELDQYLYRASHDIRRPIAGILGLIQLLEMRKLDKDTGNYIQKLKSSALNMDNMLHKLHYLYQIDKLNDRAQIELGQVVTEVIQELRPIFEGKNIDIQYFQENRLAVYANHELVKVALKCIIENSIQYANKYQVKHQVNIILNKNNRCAVITISDNGIGIHNSMQHDIFHAYVKKSSQSLGSGLGLHLAKKAIEALNGAISLRSEAGKGTTVKITLSL